MSPRAAIVEALAGTGGFAVMRSEGFGVPAGRRADEVTTIP